MSSGSASRTTQKTSYSHYPGDIEVAFFQAIAATFNKQTSSSGGKKAYLDLAVKEIVSGAIVSQGVIYLLAVAGLNSRALSILSDEFLAEVRGIAKFSPGDFTEINSRSD